MQDIDFDELDRAVSSASASRAPAVSTPSSDAVVVTNRSTVAAAPSESTTSSAPAARRSSGRFMDVVHPSSDMRSAVPERSAPRDPEPAAPAERTSDWPDPLDFHGFTGDAPKVDETPAVAPVAEEAPAEPLESPFLSDAKVVKRPLGAFSDPEPTTPAPVSIEPEETPMLEAPDEELLSFETETPVEETPAAPAAEEVPKEETPEPAVEPMPARVEEPSNGPTSITQQYKEQPSTTEQPSGAIYDTETYHQPLTHGPKKKSGALVVIWIIALILVGAGAGAAVYFFVLPML